MASAELRDTRRRIKSVQSTMKITRAMELISASRIPKATARVNQSKPYATKLVEVIRNVSGASGGASHMLLEQRPVETVGILVIASDRGLAGAYASTVIRIAERQALEYLDEGKNVRFFAVGKKAQSYFEYRKYKVDRAFLGVTDAPGYGDARAIANVGDGCLRERNDRFARCRLHQVQVGWLPGAFAVGVVADRSDRG